MFSWLRQLEYILVVQKWPLVNGTKVTEDPETGWCSAFLIATIFPAIYACSFVPLAASVGFSNSTEKTWACYLCSGLVNLSEFLPP